MREKGGSPEGGSDHPAFTWRYSPTQHIQNEYGLPPQNIREQQPRLLLPPSGVHDQRERERDWLK
jgi:hypothetical protein